MTSYSVLIIWRYQCQNTIHYFHRCIVFKIDISVWFTWIGEITAMNVLYIENIICHRFAKFHISKCFSYDFPNESCGSLVCTHIPMRRNNVVFSLYLLRMGLQFGFGPVFEKYQMKAHIPFLDPWPSIYRSSIDCVNRWDSVRGLASDISQPSPLPTESCQIPFRLHTNHYPQSNWDEMSFLVCQPTLSTRNSKHMKFKKAKQLHDGYMYCASLWQICPCDTIKYEELQCLQWSFHPRRV